MWGKWWAGINNKAGQFTNVLWGAWYEEAGWQDVSLGDFDGDGLSDVIGRTSTGGWWVGRNNKAGFTFNKIGAWYEGANWRNVVFADFNGDGRTDIAGRTSTGEWWIGKLNSAGTLENSPWAQWDESAGWIDVIARDLTGDVAPTSSHVISQANGGSPKVKVTSLPRHFGQPKMSRSGYWARCILIDSTLDHCLTTHCQCGPEHFDLQRVAWQATPAAGAAERSRKLSIAVGDFNHLIAWSDFVAYLASVGNLKPSRTKQDHADRNP